MPDANNPTALRAFLLQEALPERYGQQAQRVFLPFLEGVRAALSRGRLRVLGINGAQGSGKSTLAALIKWHFEDRHGLRVAQLSLDDFYLRRQQRLALAVSHHPLFATRGVPGTHDIPLALATLKRLRQLRAGQSMALPRFDKANDERLPEAQWPRIEGPVDLMVLEGWCLGAMPQHEVALRQAVNDLEAEEDADGRWRSEVNARLGGKYQALFAEIDYLLMLQAPGFDCVATWRQQQEEKLVAQRGGEGAALLDAAAVARFVKFYQRLSEHCLYTLPQRADCVMRLDAQRQVWDVHYRRELNDV